MGKLKSLWGANLLWWIIMLVLIGAVSVLIWIVTGDELENVTTEEVAISEESEANLQEAPIETQPAEELVPDETLNNKIVYWPDTEIDESLTTEGGLIIEAAQAFLSEKDTGFWSYVFERYNPPFALVTIEDDENGPDFNFEVILKEVDSVWQVIYEASMINETPPADIIEQYAIPTVVEIEV